MTDTKTFQSDTVFSRSEKILDTDLTEEIVMMDIDSGQYFTLTAVAANIWRQLETPKSFGALTNTLQEVFEVESEICESEVSTFLLSLLEMNVVKQNDG